MSSLHLRHADCRSINEPCTSVYRIYCSFKIITSWHKVVPLAKIDLQRKVVVLTIVTFTIRHAPGDLQGDRCCDMPTVRHLSRSRLRQTDYKTKKSSHRARVMAKNPAAKFMYWRKVLLMQSPVELCPVLTGCGRLCVHLGKPLAGLI
jgi:hypothetical protein